MATRIVLFGATGYTGGRIAERLAALGERPLLAGRSEERLAALGTRLGVEWQVADARTPRTVFELVRAGDVVVSTVGPFVRWGEAAARAAIAAPAVYLDTTGEPAFIRRVVEELGPPAGRAGATLMTAMGFDYVPGALAGALALERAGDGAARVDVGYFSPGAGPGMISRGTAASMAGAVLDPMFAFRDGRLLSVRAAERVRTFRVAGRERAAVSVGGAEHFGLPVAFPALREVNVYVGAPSAHAVQAASRVGSVLVSVPGVRPALRAAGELAAQWLPAPASGAARGAGSWIAAVAYDGGGRPLTEIHLRGADGYAFTAGFVAWAARRAAREGVAGTGAVGPIEAYGLQALERGCAEAGLERGES